MESATIKMIFYMVLMYCGYSLGQHWERSEPEPQESVKIDIDQSSEVCAIFIAPRPGKYKVCKDYNNDISIKENK